jgi:hypothetical protein
MGAGLDLLPGTDETVFIRAAQDAGTVLKSMSGFVGRRLAKAEDGTWFDLVEWSDATNATKAAEIFHTIPGAQPFCGMIDMASAKMAHHAVTVSS